MKKHIKVVLPILISLISVLMYFVIGNLVGQRSSIFGNYAYQGIALLQSLLIIFVIKRYVGKINLLTVGNLSAKTSPSSLFGITDRDNWKDVGIRFAIIISLVTFVFLYLNYYRHIQALDLSMILISIAISIPLAAINSFNEETVTRWAIIEGIGDNLPSKYIPIISGLVFGIPHFFGVPGGLIGSLMAGILGWLLAKSVQDTRGLGWAWFIHFLQDMVIIPALILPLL